MHPRPAPCSGCARIRELRIHRRQSARNESLTAGQRRPRQSAHAGAARTSPNSKIARSKEQAMNQDIIGGKWNQLKGKMQAKWGDLTDDDFDVAKGDSKYLAGKLQERYGWDRERAENEVREFERSLPPEYRH
jgi:uncharacterized protein YjbJ (UPF0337 family)